MKAFVEIKRILLDVWKKLPTVKQSFWNRSKLQKFSQLLQEFAGLEAGLVQQQKLKVIFSYFSVSAEDAFSKIINPAFREIFEITRPAPVACTCRTGYSLSMFGQMLNSPDVQNLMATSEEELIQAAIKQFNVHVDNLMKMPELVNRHIGSTLALALLVTDYASKFELK